MKQGDIFRILKNISLGDRYESENPDRLIRKILQLDASILKTLD